MKAADNNVRNLTQYPLVPEQIFLPAIYRRGEPTGMLFCPQRLSEIATMRCWEYQQTGCHCANAAPATAIAELREAMESTAREIMPQRMFDAESGGALHDNGMCKLCAVRPVDSYPGHGLCNRCYNARNAPRCAVCGGPKKSVTGRCCRSCAMKGNRGGKARAAQMRAERAGIINLTAKNAENTK